MTASELRLGNLVDLGNRIAKVIEINNLSCVVVDLEETQNTLEDYDRTKPIPLTEEWLLKFGFKAKSINHNFKIDADIDFQISSAQRVIKTNERSSFYLENNFGTKINYVHQLQNLYFALTGEELTLKSE